MRRFVTEKDLTSEENSDFAVAVYSMFEEIIQFESRELLRGIDDVVTLDEVVQSSRIADTVDFFFEVKLYSYKNFNPNNPNFPFLAENSTTADRYADERDKILRRLQERLVPNLDLNTLIRAGLGDYKISVYKIEISYRTVATTQLESYVDYTLSISISK